MNKTLFGIVASLLLLLAGCSGDEAALEQQGKAVKGVKAFTSFTATLDDAAGTRAYLDAEASDGIRRVHWNLSDVIYVYSDTDTELKKYEMTSLSEDDKAVFSGEEVTGNKFYAVYARNREITVDEDNYNIMHFSRAGMTSTYGFHGPLVATATGNALTFKQVIGIIHVTVGNINMIDKVSFSGNNREIIGGKGYVDMSESHPVLRLDDDASTISYSQIFNDSFDDKYTDIYICIPPTIFEDGFSVFITGKDSNDKEFAIEKNFNSRFEVKSGTISRFSLVDISAELEAQGGDEIIVFADPVVKQICVENWDTNKDGELSYKEAAAVTDLGQKFRNASIKSFDEFQYFTGLTSVKDSAFYGCSSLTSIELPERVTSIGKRSFFECSSLTSFKINEGVTSVGQCAFFECSSLTSIEIPESMTSIEYGAFSYCSSLTSIVIPEGVTSIGNYAFSDCSSLTSIEIPKGMTSIPHGTFVRCTSLTNIEIPERVTSIGNNAFALCSSLTSIEIPKGVTLIWEGAIYGCSSLTSIVVDKNNDYYDSRNDCNAIIETKSNTLLLGCASTVIPADVTSIGNNAFNRCSNLTSIVIPEGVTLIGERAFSDCSSLASITCLAAIPPTLGVNAFFCVSGIFYVPVTSVEAYKAADGWKDYADRIKAIPE